MHQCPSVEEDIGHEHQQCSLKREFSCLSAFSETGSCHFVLNFFCISIIHSKKNLNKICTQQNFQFRRSVIGSVFAYYT